MDLSSKSILKLVTIVSGMVARITPTSHAILPMQSKGNFNLSNCNTMPTKNNIDGEDG